MKAVVKSKGIGNVSYQEVPEPEPGPREVKIEVKATGICGTDIHIYHDRFKYKPPVVLGHEFSGIVVKVGPEVKKIKVGDRVTGEAPARICGECNYCREGKYNLCSNRLGLGWGVNGSFAKYCIVEESMLHKLPDNIIFKEAALCEPLACVVHGVLELTSVSAGDLVVVSGPGAIGLLTAQVAKAQGARVILLGITDDQERLSLALELGIDKTIDVQQEDVVGIIKNISKGYGADVVFECSGAEASSALCLEVVKKGGQYTQIGLFGKPIKVNFDLITTKELKVAGVQSQKYSAWEKALKLVEMGYIKLLPLISEELGLSEWKKGFDIVEKNTGLKVILYPEE